MKFEVYDYELTIFDKIYIHFILPFVISWVTILFVKLVFLLFSLLSKTYK